MTNAGQSPVLREMLASYFQRGRQRPIVIRLEGGIIKLRLKGTRRWHSVDVRTVWLTAVRITVEAEKRARKLARQAQRQS